MAKNTTISPSAKTTVIIGAGIIGLTAANVLQDKYPQRQFAIIAKELPNNDSPSADYASVWAGAHYRPIPVSSTQLKDESDLGRRTAKIMRKIARDFPTAGVQIMPGCEHLEDPPEANLLLKTGDRYAGEDDHFRVLEKHELPADVSWGCEYQTYCINVPLYCSWLLSRFEQRGGKVIQHTLMNVLEAFNSKAVPDLGNISTVINCSGRNFDKDPSMKIIRGQTVLVKNKYHRTVTRQNKDGSWAFLIPRPQGGGTIVGGSKEIGDMEWRARPETRQKLLEQSVRVFPDFVRSVDDFQIVKDNVGRRPWRGGGMRLEVEVLDKNQKCIIHAYGAGGRGYELSWGIAERIVDMFEKCDASSSAKFTL